MHITIDLHLHEDDVTVEPNETGTGIVIRSLDSMVPRLNVFTGTSHEERKAARRMIVAALDRLDLEEFRG